MAYQIISFAQSQLTGETVYNILCDSSSDLPSGTISGSGYSGPIVQGCSATCIDGSKYIADSSGTWILQPSAQSQIIFPDMYSKTETDALLSAKADKTDIVNLINQGQKT